MYSQTPLIASLHVTSRQPCCWCVGCQEQKHFSPLGTKTLFSSKLFNKKLYCIHHQHTNMAALSRGCKPRVRTLRGAIERVLVNGVSVLKGLNLEKM